MEFWSTWSLAQPVVVVLWLYVLVGAGICILVCMGLCGTGCLTMVVLVTRVDAIMVDCGRTVLAVVGVADVGGGVVWA